MEQDVRTRNRDRFDDEDVSTATSIAQEKVEVNIAEVYADKCEELPDVKKSLHIQYLLGVLKNLPSSYEVMDCSRTWIVYWTVHSLAILNYELEATMKEDVINFLKKCQHPEGGFGGGPGQDPHLAPTYAAVNALCILGTDEAFQIIDRKNLGNFLKKLKVGDGSFYMHEGGEIDTRSVYCCAAVATLTNIKDSELFDKSVDWIASCQTYEGGFSGTPGSEAHGGYTFCGISALYILGRVDKCDKKSLNRWILNRQTSFEGGFQGRTNKLVDSCYSFWQLGALSILNLLGLIHGQKSDWHFDNDHLQEYLLICCQHVRGGFIDKPTTSHDPYHTCYSLSGLTIAQSTDSCETVPLGGADNKLVEIHPVYNLTMKSFHKAKHYFSDLS